MIKISRLELRWFVAAALLITCCCIRCFSQGSSRVLMDPAWVLVPSLSDEFNDSTIDNQKWTWAPPWGTFHGGPESSQACLSQKKTNRREEGGSLKLSATPTKNTCYTWDGQPLEKPYTTGALYSLDTVKYGYFEIRVRIPDFIRNNTEGFGPNFWMWHLMPYDDHVWSEIDIYEFNAANNTHTCNVHYESIGMEEHWSLRSVNGDRADIPMMDFDNQWHVFACEWTENAITFYHNGEYICGTNQYCRDQKYMNLVIDLNVPAINFNYMALDENADLPYVYEIDYIRTYQRVGGYAPKTKKQARHERKALKIKVRSRN